MECLRRNRRPSPQHLFVDSVSELLEAVNVTNIAIERNGCSCTPIAALA